MDNNHQSKEYSKDAYSLVVVPFPGNVKTRWSILKERVDELTAARLRKTFSRLKLRLILCADNLSGDCQLYSCSRIKRLLLFLTQHSDDVPQRLSALHCELYFCLTCGRFDSFLLLWWIIFSSASERREQSPCGQPSYQNSILTSITAFLVIYSTAHSPSCFQIQACFSLASHLHEALLLFQVRMQFFLLLEDENKFIHSLNVLACFPSCPLLLASAGRRSV